jgi:hypothetical protein
MDQQEVQPLELKDQLKHTLEECRMVLPGMQAIFGFQLIAVFNESFSKKLTQGEQIAHLVATGLMTVAIALAMSPAALHRQSEPDQVSKRLLIQSSGLLTWAMVPLAVATVIDLYLLSHIVLKEQGIAAVIALGFLAFLLAMWFLFPQLAKMQRKQREQATAREPLPER